MHILLIEDEKITRITLSDTIREKGFKITACSNGKDGLRAFRQDHFDVVVTDLRLPQMSGIDVLKKIKESNASCPVIVMTAYASVDTAVRALKLGAYDYLTKPFSPDELLALLDKIKQLQDVLNENIKLKKRIRSFQNRTLVGESKVMRTLISTLEVVAQNDFTVLIEGESGTGKEVVARFLHFHSPRSRKPFIAVNCAAIPESLLESELFGYEKGAFTGANKKHVGYFERADGGTLFIDDIDDMPHSIQVKLLRFLQEKEISRIGGSAPLPLNLRIIVATKVDLKQLIRENKFREDLYYRLNIIPLKLPPLRERKEDIPLLLEHFFDKHGSNQPHPSLNASQMRLLEAYDWPGNVRELENVVGRLLAMPGSDYFLEQLRPAIDKRPSRGEDRNLSFDFQPFDSLQSFLRSQEQNLIRQALKEAGNNISDAARLLKIPRSTLRSKMDKLHITVSETGSD